jgi:hypothetical protein
VPGFILAFLDGAENIVSLGEVLAADRLVIVLGPNHHSQFAHGIEKAEIGETQRYKGLGMVLIGSDLERVADDVRRKITEPRRMDEYFSPDSAIPAVAFVTSNPALVPVAKGGTFHQPIYSVDLGDESVFAIQFARDYFYSAPLLLNKTNALASWVMSFLSMESASDAQKAQQQQLLQLVSGVFLIGEPPVEALNAFVANLATVLQGTSIAPPRMYLKHEDSMMKAI